MGCARNWRKAHRGKAGPSAQGGDGDALDAPRLRQSAVAGPQAEAQRLGGQYRLGPEHAPGCRGTAAASSSRWGSGCRRKGRQGAVEARAWEMARHRQSRRRSGVDRRAGAGYTHPMDASRGDLSTPLIRPKWGEDSYYITAARRSSGRRSPDARTSALIITILFFRRTTFDDAVITDERAREVASASQPTMIVVVTGGGAALKMLRFVRSSFHHQSAGPSARRPCRRRGRPSAASHRCQQHLLCASLRQRCSNTLGHHPC